MRGQTVGRDHAGVPFALDTEGQVADPASAHASNIYRCLACNEQVSPVREYKRRVGNALRTWRAHFSHRKGSACQATGESVAHRAAKRLLGQSLERHRAFTLELCCPDCGRVVLLDYSLPENWTVALEVLVGPYRADVAIMDPEGRVALAVEVLIAHQVQEAKALGLSTRWVEVVGDAEGLLAGLGTPVTLRVVNTNLFRFHPCECGNAASSNAQAMEHKAERLRQEAEARRAQEEARLRQRQREYLAAVQVERARRAREESKAPAGGGAPSAVVEADGFIRAFLAQHLSDIFSRLQVFTCVAAPCPSCGTRQVFFDSAGMNQVPFWSPLAYRETPFHPWQSMCPACGWRGPSPPPGVRVMYHGAMVGPLQRPSPRAPVTASPLTTRQASEVPRFWWNDD